MTNVRTSDGKREVAYEGICTNHGTVALASYDIARQQTMIHMATRDSGAFAIEGRDFVIAPAPLRCDLCGVITEPPGWDYKTDRVLDEIGDADGEWLVCDECHVHVKAGKIKPLVERAVNQHVIRSGGEMPSKLVRKVIKEQFKLFLEHCSEGVRES